MKKIAKRVLAVLCILSAANVCVSFAQMADDVELSREVLQTQRKALVAKNMDMTEEESQVFWPVYNDYRAAVREVNDRKVKLITDYAANYGTLSDEKAEEMLSEFLKIQKAEVKVKKGYVKKFKRVLPIKKVLRFYQVENKLDAIVNFQLARDIPLVK
jgi:hypothetical protein